MSIRHTLIHNIWLPFPSCFGFSSFCRCRCCCCCCFPFVILKRCHCWQLLLLLFSTADVCCCGKTSKSFSPSISLSIRTNTSLPLSLPNADANVTIEAKPEQNETEIAATKKKSIQFSNSTVHNRHGIDTRETCNLRIGQQATVILIQTKKQFDLLIYLLRRIKLWKYAVANGDCSKSLMVFWYISRLPAFARCVFAFVLMIEGGDEMRAHEPNLNSKSHTHVHASKWIYANDTLI